MADTSTGMKENVAGALCYVLGWITGIVFIIIERENKFVRFHAFQSIIVFAILFILSVILTPIWGFFGTVIWIISFILWILLIVMAAQEKKYKLPWAGNLAEKWAGG